MKIIAKYLISFGFAIVEVVEIENGAFYRIEYSKFGVPDYIEMDKETFYDYKDDSKNKL